MASDTATAIVTGGGRGIGRVLARRLAAEGIAVGLTGRDAVTLAAAQRDIEDAGGRAVSAVADVACWDQVEAAIAAFEQRLGAIDLLVNNAGTAVTGNLWETDPSDWWRVVEVNLRGALHWSRAVLPGMVARNRGRIVNICSYAAVRPTGRSSAYAVSKAGLVRLTDSLAEQLKDTAVKVIALNPGMVQTDLTTGVFGFTEVQWDPPERAAELLVAIAAGRADPLSGRFIHAHDDLDELLSRMDEISEHDLLQLRLYRRPGERQA